MPTYSPLWGESYSPLVGLNPLERGMFRLVRRMPVNQELLDELIGATAGATALKQRSQVAANLTENGGVRTIESRTYINRATTSADRANLRAAIADVSYRSTEPNLAGRWPA